MKSIKFIIKNSASKLSFALGVAIVLNFVSMSSVNAQAMDEPYLTWRCGIVQEMANKPADFMLRPWNGRTTKFTKSTNSLNFSAPQGGARPGNIIFMISDKGEFKGFFERTDDKFVIPFASAKLEQLTLPASIKTRYQPPDGYRECEISILTANLNILAFKDIFKSDVRDVTQNVSIAIAPPQPQPQPQAQAQAQAQAQVQAVPQPTIAAPPSPTTLLQAAAVLNAGTQILQGQTPQLPFENTKSKLPSGIESLVTKANDGDLQSMNALGNIYRLGTNGVSKDILESKKWFELAANKGYTASIFNLGILYQNGAGVIAQDLQLAKKYFETAASQGSKPAELRLKEVMDTLDPPKPKEPPRKLPEPPRATKLAEIKNGEYRYFGEGSSDNNVDKARFLSICGKTDFMSTDLYRMGSQFADPIAHKLINESGNGVAKLINIFANKNGECMMSFKVNGIYQGTTVNSLIYCPVFMIKETEKEKYRVEGVSLTKCFKD